MGCRKKNSRSDRGRGIALRVGMEIICSMLAIKAWLPLSYAPAKGRTFIELLMVRSHWGFTANITLVLPASQHFGLVEVIRC